MPAKHRIKQYIENGLYHILNRGVAKNLIFTSEQDYHVFQSYLATYLLPKDTDSLQSILNDAHANQTDKSEALQLLHLNNFSDSIKLFAYSLMPNHFHLYIRQQDMTAIDQFMNSLCTRYSMYFNTNHRRVGKLYQDVYKAVPVNNDEHSMYLTKYIHRNCLSRQREAYYRTNHRDIGSYLFSYPYSSLPEYLGLRKTPWIHHEEIFSLMYPNSASQIDAMSRYKRYILEDDLFHSSIHTNVDEEF